VDLRAEAVAGAVGEEVPVTRCGDDVSRCRVDAARGRAGADGGERGLHGGIDHGMDLGIALGGVADRGHAGDVGIVAVLAGADVDDDGVARLEHGLAGVMMREGAVGAGADDGEFRPGALGGEGLPGDGGEFGLGDAGADRGAQRGLGAVGDGGVHAQRGDLGRFLEHAQRAERLGGEAAGGGRQGVDQHQREIGAHRLVEADAGGCGIRGGERAVEGRVGAVLVAPFPERQVGVLAGVGGVERGHQEAGGVGADQHQAGALVGMGREACEPAHVRAGAEGDEAGAGRRHAGAQAGEAGGERVGHRAGLHGNAGHRGEERGRWSATRASRRATVAGVKWPSASRMLTVPTTRAPSETGMFSAAAQPSALISAWSGKTSANSAVVLATKLRPPSITCALQRSLRIGLAPEAGYSAGCEE
jgi:hypothetical protein